MYKIILTFLIFAFSSLSSFAQFNNLSRRYTPVVQKTAAAPLYELNISEWTAFRYNRATDEWQAFPFQFDQLTTSGNYDKEPDGIADATDEIIFMPQDAGDKADTWAWVDDENARRAERIELEFDDPLQPNEKAWIYLYKNVAPLQTISSYLSYKPGPAGAPAADTINTDVFILGHDKNGWIDYFSLASGGNIIDRFKLRMAGKMLIGPAYEINEDFVQAETGADAVSYYPGPVRSFHNTKAAILISKLGLPLLPDKSNFAYHYQYTPYSFQIIAETDIDAGMLALFGVKTIRQSLDFNENARGMKVYSQSNRDGILIDGVADAYNSAVNDAGSQNWVMAAGESGAVVLFVDISLMKNSERLLYLHDDENGGPSPDGTADTGDMRSFGDMGLMLRATGSALITERLTIKFKGYFIDQPNLDADFGERLLAREQNPLTMQASVQTYEPTQVTQQHESLPNDFYLAPAYPNPFSASAASRIHFEFFGRKNGVYDLVVYNVLGRRVRQFQDIRLDADGQRTLTWNGRDSNGEPLSPGVYFYQAASGAQKHTQKLVISQ